MWTFLLTSSRVSTVYSSAIWLGNQAICKEKKIWKGKMISEFVHKVTLLKTHSLYLLYISLYLIHYISSLPSTWITLLLAGTFQKGKKWEKPWTAG